ncbi:unannotated protein [freshwater metagenome]|uniref:Unannotated protein n=1 Tax=freshwater metagenome TaxID=449393 RepID=A0A6J7T794_9ZZZZ
MKTCSFIMQESGRVHPPDICRACIMMFAVTRFIAETPHNDARMIAIAFDHSRNSRKPRGRESWVVTQTGIEGMTLNICLINDIQAVFIAQVIKAMIIGIMRCSHGIDIGLFHRHDVLTHIFKRHCFTSIRVMIVAIHTHDGDRLTIDAH